MFELERKINHKSSYDDPFGKSLFGSDTNGTTRRISRNLDLDSKKVDDACVVHLYFEF